MKDQEKAVLAGGCFWGMQDLFRKQPGVILTRVGYAGGAPDTATYNAVKQGNTGHAEAIEVVFDPKVTDFERILRFFFQVHDPTTKNRQGNDVGSQYRSAIFCQSEEQKRIAQSLIEALDGSGIWPGPVTTEICEGREFYEAEAFHQDYLEKNPGGYTCHWVRPNWILPEGT